ncbi:MAG TPA: hypothetical protein VGO93_16935 [Candidatus Xenobia bacterium]|jgi:outer membrane protein TolC
MESLYRECRDQSLKTWTQLMNPQAYVEMTQASTDHFMAGQRKMLDLTRQMVDASEMPSKQDFQRIEALVRLAEERAEAVEAQVHQAEARLAALAARPKKKRSDA